ncbi:MAG: hypothetical protein WA890_01120 [Micromonospora sp.]
MVNSVLAIVAGIACIVFCRPLARRIAEAPHTPGGRHKVRIALVMSVLAGALLIAWGISWLLSG